MQLREIHATDARKNAVNNEKTGSKKITFGEVSRIAANISQVLILIVAVFGYFYTVIPVYQKEQLAEDIVQKQKQVEGLASSLEQLEKDKAFIRAQIEKDNLIIVEQNKTISKFNSQIEELNSQISIKNKKINKILNDTKYAERNLRKAQIALEGIIKRVLVDNIRDVALGVYLENVKGSNMFPNVEFGKTNSNTITKIEEIEIEIAKCAPPFNAIQRSLSYDYENICMIYNISFSIKDDIIKKLSLFLEKNEDLKQYNINMNYFRREFDYTKNKIDSLKKGKYKSHYDRRIDELAVAFSDFRIATITKAALTSDTFRINAFFDEFYEKYVR